MSATRRIGIASLINELLFGGDEHRLLSFSKTIDAGRFDHRVVCVKRADLDFDSRNGTMRQHYIDAGIRLDDLGEGYPNQHSSRAMVPVNRSVMLTRSVARFCRYIRENQIDVIDAHLGSGSLVGAIAGGLMKVPVAITTYQVEQWKPLWLWQRVHPVVLRAAGAVITDSTACAQAVASFMEQPLARVTVIPNGIETPVSGRSREEMRKLLGLPDDPRVRIIGQIATLLPTKGQDVLLDAAKRVLEQERDVFFLLVGYPRDPVYAERLKEKALRLGIADRVRICGYPDGIGDVWKVIDIHTHPTALDSLPQAIMEGMSLGLPAVVTPTGGIPTMVENEETGLIVPVKDPATLAGALLRLLREPETAARLGHAAQERYRARYTTAIMTRALEDLFAGLAVTSGYGVKPAVEQSVK
jgi:glycosyltransferase involved in cell wall biosynthesis